MAQHLDLEEQEQLDQLKHFWKRWGDLISWGLIIVFGSYAAWNGYQYWQRSQAAKAGVLFEEIERAAQAKELTRLEQALTDIRASFGSTAYAQRAALIAAAAYAEQSQSEKALAALTWVVDKASDEGLQAVARLRLAGLLADDQKFDQALQQLVAKVPAEFAPLVADRRADILMLQGKPAEAKAEYLKAYQAMPATHDYRKLIEFKLNGLGVDPAVTAPAPATAS